jgi:hypothetical protein
MYCTCYVYTAMHLCLAGAALSKSTTDANLDLPDLSLLQVYSSYIVV